MVEKKDARYVYNIFKETRNFDDIGSDYNIKTNGVDDSEISLLDIAILKRDYRLVDFLLEKKVNEGDRFVFAVENNNYDIVCKFVNSGYDVYKKYKYTSPIGKAIDIGNIRMVEFFIKCQGVKQEYLNTKAIASGNVDLVRLLLDNGCDIKNDKQALSTISSIGMAEFCYENGFDIFSDFNGMNLLHINSYNNIDLCEYLISIGFDPRSRCKKGHTPLFYSLTSSKSVEFFIKYGFDDEEASLLWERVEYIKEFSEEESIKYENLLFEYNVPTMNNANSV